MIAATLVVVVIALLLAWAIHRIVKPGFLYTLVITFGVSVVARNVISLIPPLVPEVAMYQIAFAVIFGAYFLLVGTLYRR